jgi:hypothetical protein
MAAFCSHFFEEGELIASEKVYGDEKRQRHNEGELLSEKRKKFLHKSAYSLTFSLPSTLCKMHFS